MCVCIYTYICIYIYIYSVRFNVLDAKMVLKINLFIKKKQLKTH